MGDIRNKLAKIEGRRRDKEVLGRAVQAWANAQKRKAGHSVHSAAPERCACGHDHSQADLIVVDAGGWPREQMVYCPACVPENHRDDMQRALDLKMLGRVSP